MSAARRDLSGLFALLLAVGCGSPGHEPSEPTPDALRQPGEEHFGAIRQLTFGGQNAEAYWSWGGDRLVLQVTKDEPGDCDHIYVLDAEGGALQPVTHAGR